MQTYYPDNEADTAVRHFSALPKTEQYYKGAYWSHILQPQVKLLKLWKEYGVLAQAYSQSTGI